MQNARRQMLMNRWVRLFPHVSLERSLHVFDKLWDAYNEPHRSYHSIAHIEYLLRMLDEFFPSAPIEVELALWFHDVIYIPGDPDNELRSALFAELQLTYLKCSPETIRRVTTAILTTKNHYASDVISMIVCDLDLMSLALPRDEYMLNTAQIRQEYAAYSDEVWRQGHLSFVIGFLERPAIYMMANCREWLEAATRRNLELDRELLSTTPPQSPSV